MSSARIGVYGATGQTGRLVAELLFSRGAEVVLGGRDEEKLEALAEVFKEGGTRPPEVRVASLDDEAALRSFMRGLDLVVNCAGPFVELAQPVVKAAVSEDVHYLDISGEQVHMKWILDTFDELARERELVLFPGCAFEFVLGDIAAEFAWCEAASRIVVAYVVKDMKMTEGTKKSLWRSFAVRGLTFVEGQHEERKFGYRLFDVPLPEGGAQKGVWVPGGECLTVPRRGGVSRVETCVAAGEGLAYFVGTFSTVIPSLLKAMQPLADRVAQKQGKRGAEEDPFMVVSFDPKTEQIYSVLRGTSIYRVTAQIVVESALRIVRDKPRKHGFVGAPDLFEAVEFLKSVDVEVLVG